ncbi:MAG: hypothetical protein KAJ48_03980, partial [Elusimicrobiales bacterium]|nr:hypothetical protein [Elusimicrobiales bacterium]
ILTVESSDTLNHSSSKTVNFTIDKTSPTLAVSGVSGGGYYEQSVLPIISAADINFSTVSAFLNTQPFVIGSTISASGNHILEISAFDLAGNIASSQISFTVDLPSQKPKNVSAFIENGSAVELIWEKPQTDVSLYKIFKDGVYLGPVNTDQNTFRDTSYVSDTSHIYEIAAIDSKGREGERAEVEIQPVSFNLAGYGTFSSASNREALNRGFFDFIRLNIINKSAQEIQAGPFEVKIDSASALSQTISVGALSSVEASATVFVSTSLADSVSVSVVLTLPALGDAISLTAVKTFTLNIRNPLQPIVEIFPEPLIRGAYSKVKVKFNNRGSAPMDIITGKVSGSKTLPSPSIAIELKTQE